ncbi:hypothetical protein AAJ76_2200035307 [Vairimorpha ceranae]|uniref:Uncharacterized protein n=1 Tax=Vairimorpha ceranae TaxID=40302 RepID=A0A0F9WFA1_9MICR|nr:hypothetical protein AAJ76_2200035307 [Vairimorpha ceranae]KKO75410.1 hypothetical protein AAJ76_2200035307 [Vairimorpha ceranae]
MDLFNNSYLYYRHVKAINLILLIDMFTSLLSYNNINNRICL